MSIDPYRRYNPRDRPKDKKINNQELIFGITQKDLFKQEIYPLNRLTGNKGTSHSMPKNKNTIIHSNSTNLLNKAIKNNQSSNLKENNYNININVNNLIINNNKENNSNQNSNKVFSKIGSDIIDGKILLNNDVKKNKGQKKPNKGSVSVQKKLQKEKYEPLSNIQGVINNLMEITKSPPPPFDNNINVNIISPIGNDLNKSSENIQNNNNLNTTNKDNHLNPILDEKNIEIHFKLWDILINMELHAENKMGLTNQIKKILSLMETDFTHNNNKIIIDIFNNNQLNFSYNKTIKITFF